MSVEFLLKLRDAAQMIADVANEELEKHNPEATFKNEPEKIPWVKAVGFKSKEPYERYPAFQQQPTRTIEYTNLLESIKNSKGRFQHGGLFYWLFEDGTTIGRKPTKKR